MRFVVLHHTGVPDPHFDLMLEIAPDALLATWRCPAWPLHEPTIALRLPDHRRIYLDYEGPISNNRGEVRQVARGVFVWVVQTPARWEVRLSEGGTLLLEQCGADRWRIAVQDG